MKLLGKKLYTVISAAIALTICASFLTITASTADITTLADAAAVMIYTNEGSYSSVNPNDSGSVSIGKVQWHAVRALNLLKTIVSMNESQAKSILGDALYTEIKTLRQTGRQERLHLRKRRLFRSFSTPTRGILRRTNLQKPI